MAIVVVLGLQGYLKELKMRDNNKPASVNNTQRKVSVEEADREFIRSLCGWSQRPLPGSVVCRRFRSNRGKRRVDKEV